MRRSSLLALTALFLGALPVSLAAWRITEGGFLQAQVPTAPGTAPAAAPAASAAASTMQAPAAPAGKNPAAVAKSASSAAPAAPVEPSMAGRTIPALPVLTPLSAEIRATLTPERLSALLPPRTPENAAGSDAPQLGCFTGQEDVWTENRKKCAEDQRPFVEYVTVESRGGASSAAAPTATRLHAALDDEFTKEGARTEKMATLREMVKKFFLILQQENLRGTVTASPELLEHTAKVQELSVGLDGLSVMELNGRLAVMRDQSAALAVVVAAAKKDTPVSAARIPTDDEAAGMEKRLRDILAKAAGVQSLLSMEGIALSPDTVTALATANRNMDYAGTACPSVAECPILPDTVVALVTWRNGVRRALDAAGRPDLLTRAETMLGE